jgi:C4-dicarboxylate transporter
VAAPIASIFFYGKYITEGFGHWGFSLMILVIGLLEFFLDRKSYKALDVKNLSNMNMTQATENIIKHKQLRNMTNKILILPLIALIIWTIPIASGYTWNIKVISLTVLLMGVSISWGLSQMKKNQKRLESVLEQIKKLRE